MNNSSSGEFYGKYRGTVTNIKDPKGMGRIKAKVPDVMGDQESGWAMPCAPFAGSNSGFFALPSENASVWIEFEQGDPERPIWSGCWWSSRLEMPPILLTPPPYKKLLIKTKGGHSVLLDDTPGSGGITLKTSTGQTISLTAKEIEISNGKGASIKLTGPQVSINGGALEVK